MSKINLNPGDSIVTKNQNGIKGIPVDARTQVQYYKDIQNIEYAYENLQVIVTDDDPTDSQHPKGIYVITKLDGNNDVDPSGIKSLKQTVNVTKQDVGLENVDNVKQVPQTRTINNKPLNSDVTLSANDVGAIPTTQKGANDGVAELDSNGKLKSTQIPTTVATTDGLNQKVDKTRTINNKPLNSDVTLSANDVGAIPTTQKGANDGVAELDSNGKLKSTQIPTTVATTDGLNQKVDKISNAEGNLPKINNSGNLENSGFSIPTTENSDQILGYDGTLPGKLKWINKPIDGQNGDSAYQTWLDINQHQSTDPGYSETDFINSLKAHIGKFQYEDTDPDVVSSVTNIGDPVSSINSLIPGDGNNGTDNTLDVIVLMNNGDAVTPKTMMFSTSGDSTNGYRFYYVGDLQSAMPSNVLTENRIVNDLTIGGSGNVASAETVNMLRQLSSKETNIPLPPRRGGIITSTGSNVWYSGGDHYEIRTKPNEYYLLEAGSELTRYCFLKNIPTDNDITNQATPLYADGWTDTLKLMGGETILLKAPSNGNFLYVFGEYNSIDRTPNSVKHICFVENGGQTVDEDGFIDATLELMLQKVYPFGVGFIREEWYNGLGFKGAYFPVSGICSVKLAPGTFGGVVSGWFLSSKSESPTIGSNINALATLKDYAGNYYSYDPVEMNVPDGASYLFINVMRTNSTPLSIYPSIKVRKNTSGFKGTKPESLIYFESKCLETNLGRSWSSAQLQDSSASKDVGAAIKFPLSYKAYGKPSPIIAVFHGAEASVTRSSFGSNWNDLIQNYLDNGYVVFDTNGFTTGAFNVDSNKGASPWGCPRAVEALKNIFGYITENYNVEKSMYIHGYSAGGCLAYSFTMNYPSCVKAVSLFEPSQPTNNARENHSTSSQEIIQKWYNLIAINYGYESWNAAVADNFRNFIGYSLPLSFKRVNNGVLEPIGNLILSEQLIDGLSGYFPRPLRIFQGSEQGSGVVPISQTLNTNIVNALQNGGSNASLRLVPGIIHSDFANVGGDWTFLRDEELLFFKRF